MAVLKFVLKIPKMRILELCCSLLWDADLIASAELSYCSHNACDLPPVTRTVDLITAGALEAMRVEAHGERQSASLRGSGRRSQAGSKGRAAGHMVWERSLPEGWSWKPCRFWTSNGSGKICRIDSVFVMSHKLNRIPYIPLRIGGLKQLEG